MSRIFSDVLQMSIVAAWMISIVMVFRLLLKRAPKWVNLVLWGLVGLRLVCPFVPESRFSLMPKLPILSGYLYGNMIGNSAGNAFRADTLQSGTNFSNNISQTALDGSMGAAGSGMGGVFGIWDRSVEDTGTAIIHIHHSLAGRCDPFYRLCGIQLRQGAEAGSGSYVAEGEPVDL
jgi:hypothetical protein